MCSSSGSPFVRAAIYSTFSCIYVKSPAGGRKCSILYRALPSTFRTNQNNKPPDRLFLQRHQPISVWMDSSLAGNIRQQGYRSIGRQIAKADKFCTVAPNICGSSIWNLLMSLFWRSEFWEGSYTSLNLWAPVLQSRLRVRKLREYRASTWTVC